LIRIIRAIRIIRNSFKLLPKINRLTKKKDFDAVFKRGETIKNDFLVCKSMGNHLPEGRFGFIVSKKVSSKATQRNKIKRRLRDAAFYELKNLKKPADVVIIALPQINKKEFLEIQAAIAKFFKKI